VITAADLSDEFLNNVSIATLDFCMPLYWHDRTLGWPKPVTGASCFALKFSDKIVVVTAAHVFRTFEKQLRQNPRLVCQIRLLPFDLKNRLIDIDDDLDIASFALMEKELPGFAVDCRYQWPPPHPECGRGLSLAGFPELMREVYSDGSGLFQAYGALPAVEAISDRRIITMYDPTRDQPLMVGVPAPPVGFNMSGCSGGIVLLPEMADGRCRVHAVGLIGHGSRHDEGHVTDSIFGGETDAILIRRIHCIMPDGTLDRR
jgi:hypothetical protein